MSTEMAGSTNLKIAPDRRGMGNPSCKTGRMDRIVSMLNDVDRFSEAGEDTLYEQLFVIVEVACKFYYSVRQKLTEAEAAVHSAQYELDAMRKDPFKSCSKCVDLEKELSTYKKKLQENESRIKSIASILSLRSSQELEEDSSSPYPSSVSRAYHLVSQMLLDTKDGSATIKKRRRSDPQSVENIQPGTLAEETMKLEMNSPGPNVCVPETIYPDGKELFSTPHKGGPSQKEKFSPVLRSATKRSLGKKDHDEEGDLGVKVLDATCVSPSLLTDASTGAQVQKKRADFWQLRTTHTVDVEPIRSLRTRKLKQSQLVLGCHSRKQDVSSLKDFNGGIRPNQTSTQLPRKKEILDENEMLERAIRESLKESRIQPTDDVVEKSPSAEHTRLKRNEFSVQRCACTPCLLCAL
ncbi:uncharacterized protein [Anabrus simplex]|uniref:uncharacterized protein isoform X2 n=1 Tax=Anabrus simplex TaxID=316456 RepID=UPI0035A26A7D